MMRLFALLALGLAISGCTSSPVPEGYTGPLAHIEDSTGNSETPGVDFFVLDAVNGQAINESIAATLSANYGQGFYMQPVVVGRDVPAQRATFTIRGTTHYAAPILALTNTVFRIEGQVTFTPAANGRYVVRGKLGKHHSAVWIEEVGTGRVMDRKIERRDGG